MTVVMVLDVIINALFIFESLMVMLSVPMTIKIEKAFDREIDYVSVFLSSGTVDLVVAVLCAIWRNSNVGSWLRIIRVVTLARVFLEISPYIQILLVIRNTRCLQHK